MDGLIYAYGMSGNKSEALKVLDKLNRLNKEHHTQLPWENQLFIYIGLGEHDQAFELLEKAYHNGLSVKRLLDTPYLDPLRSDSRSRTSSGGLASPSDRPRVLQVVVDS